MSGGSPIGEVKPPAGAAPVKAAPDPEVPERPLRRHFTVADKLRVLGEADAVAKTPGGIAALLRREGLCSSHLMTWRRERKAGARGALAPRVRDGTLKLSSFGTYVSPIRQKIRSLLEGAGAVASAHGKAAALCRGILDLEAAMRTFARVPSVEPTNNASERSLRHAVVWRNSSLGTHSPEGSRFVERILTTVASLRRWGRGLNASLRGSWRARLPDSRTLRP